MSFFRKTPTVLLCLWLLLASCGHRTDQGTALNIATASNMQFAMGQIAEAFTVKTGIPCELIIGSSGKLTAQIKEGAPYDLFISANMKYPEEIARSGLAAIPPKHYAYGALVLWTMTGGVMPSIDMLKSPGVTHIAIANPKTAPYGQAALEILTHYGLLDQLKEKLVYGESIAQTNQFILSGAAEVGFTSLSIVKSPEMKGKGRWIPINPEFHKPIVQGMVLLKRTNGLKPGAREFYNFLLSDEAGEVLKNFGYSVHE